MPPFAFQAFVSIDDTLIESWRKLMGLNTDFVRSMLEEAQFDWASCLVAKEPEDLYVREWSCQAPFLTIPMHYATAMMELTAATQRAWVDAWGHMFGLPALLPTMADFTATAAAVTAGAAGLDVVDVPASAIRETPHPREGKTH
jgi:hypothetical protein